MNRRKKAELKRRQSERVMKIVLALIGVGVITGASIVIGLNGIMKKIFVNESWPDEEWSSDDWAEEELEN